MTKTCTAIAMGVACLSTLTALFIWGTPATIPDSNGFLDDFVGQNWILLLLMYNIFKAVFPNSKVLEAIGATLSSKFPLLRQPERRRTDRQSEIKEEKV